MSKTSHQLLILRGPHHLGLSISLEPVAKCRIEGLLFLCSAKPGTLNQIFLGAQSDVLHYFSVHYYSVEYTWRFWRMPTAIQSCQTQAKTSGSIQ